MLFTKLNACTVYQILPCLIMKLSTFFLACVSSSPDFLLYPGPQLLLLYYQQDSSTS